MPFLITVPLWEFCALPVCTVCQILGDILINHFLGVVTKNEVILDDSYMYMQLWIDSVLSFEPHREKTGFLHICENKDADQLQRLCFRYTESTIPLLPKSEISSLEPSSVAVQPGLCGTWSETLKTGFLTTKLIS